MSQLNAPLQKQSNNILWSFDTTAFYSTFPNESKATNVNSSLDYNRCHSAEHQYQLHHIRPHNGLESTDARVENADNTNNRRNQMNIHARNYVQSSKLIRIELEHRN